MTKELKAQICYHCDKDISGKEWVDAAGKKHSIGDDPKPENMAWCGKDCYARYMKTLAPPPGITPDVKGLRDEIKEMRNDYNHSISYWENHEEGMANLYLAKRETLDKVLEIIDSLPVAEPKGVCTCGFSTEYQHDITGKCRRCHKWILHHLIALAESPEPKGLTPEEVDEISKATQAEQRLTDRISEEFMCGVYAGIQYMEKAVKSRLPQTEERE